MSATPRTSPSSTPTLPARHIPARNRPNSNGRRAPQSRRSPDAQRRNQQTAERKKVKERTNRGGFQEVVQTDQDFLICYGNGSLVGGNAQTSGNATSSGLLFTKIELKLRFHAVALGMVDRMFKQAVLDDKVDEFLAEAEEYLQRLQEHGDPTYGTLLYNPDEKCRHEGKEKTCLVHGHPNWWQCRHMHSKEWFEKNFETWLRSQRRTSGGKGKGRMHKL